MRGAHLPRELPFEHHGFGQDDEWVAANFVNATEILAVGYPQWVDAQVGVGLTNGLYKLTVAVADDPPETMLISVGEQSVAVTNAGEYVFLQDKVPARKESTELAFISTLPLFFKGEIHA